jgi:hypothetical protein
MPAAGRLDKQAATMSSKGLRAGRTRMLGELSGGCVCGAVRYRLAPGFRFRPHACHCRDCQSRTGSAFSEHMLFARANLEIEGALDSGVFQQPSGAVSTLWGCPLCKVRIFSENAARPGMATLRCGTLDRSAEVVPAAHFWVRSKQPWVVLPAGVPALMEQPQGDAEWLALLGPLPPDAG